MNDIISSILQSSLSLAILFLIYYAFLRNDTFFKTNRIYLLLAMLFSVCIPFINVSVFLPNSSPTYLILLDPVIITGENVQSTITENTSIFQVILIIYLTGVAIFSIRFIYQLTQLLFLIRRYGIRKKEGIHFVFTDKNFYPFSFFNLVFFNQSDTDNKDAKKIIAHERVHIKQWHSLDLMLLEIITIIQWFNPFIWMYRHAIKTLHEYLADEGVLHSGVDVKVYSALLFSQSTGIQINDLTNNFSKSLLKRRFMMMTKTKSTRLARLKLIFAFPLAITMMLVISYSPNVMGQVEEKKAPPPPPKQEQTNQDKPVAPDAPDEAKIVRITVVDDVGQTDEESAVFTVVEEMPEYPGGTDAFIQYLSENIKYPETARKNKITGKAYITFIIEKDGEVTNVQLLRGFNDECDKEALRVVREMPNWKPGKQRGKAVRVQYNVPIKFTLDTDEKVEK